MSLTSGRIDVQAALAFVSSPYCGGTSLFLGTTRITENGASTAQRVEYLTYEAYEEMALSTMRQIVAQLLDKAGDSKHRAFVCHRLGRVNLGEESILIAVSSPHRASSHTMVMDILNAIKAKVPIWKQICFEDEEENTTTTTTKSESTHWSPNSEAFWLERK